LYWTKRKLHPILQLLRLTKVGLVRNATYQALWKTNLFHSISRWTKPGLQNLELRGYILSNIEFSKSQLQQDLIAQFLFERNSKRKQGYFVEFGATNGIELSNTFLLEKFFEWDGILAEPSRRYASQLQVNRNCNLDFRCVYSRNGLKINFTEMEIGEHSSIQGYSRTPSGASGDIVRDSYKVETTTLEQLLITYNAPRFIDFISIDTEGTEFLILKDFNFNRFTFGFIAVELSQNIDEIDKLLITNGYVKVLSNFSGWDGWYVSRENAQHLF